MAVHKQSPPVEISPLLSPPDSETCSETPTDMGEGLLDHDAANQSVGAVRAVLIILSLWVLIFLQAANMSGLTTTQSKIAEDLDAFSEASWFTSSYLIAMSSIAPLAGRLSQIFSARNCIFVSSMIFSVGVLVTSQAPTLATFLFGRAVTGIGAAGILTISMILVLELTGKKRRGLFIGMVNAGYTSGVSLGAVISGAMLPVVGWRALFWAQTPFSFLAGTVVVFSIPKSFVSGPQTSKTESMRQKLAHVDYLGAATLSLSIVLFLYGMASATIQWIPILFSPLLLALFVLDEIYVATVPIIPVTVLKSRGVFLTCLAQLGFMAARWTVLFYTPVYTIAVRGWVPAAAGTILIPTNLGFGMGGLLAGWLHIRRAGSFYLSCIVVFLFFSITSFILSQLSTLNSPINLYVLATFANGLCTGAALNYTLAHLLHLSLPETHFIVTGLLATFRGFAGSFGSAIGGGIFSRLLKSTLEQGFLDRGLGGKAELVRQLLGSPALVSSLTGEDKDVAISGYVVAIQGLFAAGSGLAALMILAQAGTGWREPIAKDDNSVSDEENHED